MKTTEFSGHPLVFDKMGRRINPGDFIAYGHALGRCAGLRIGKVLKVVSEPTPEFRTWGPRWIFKITVRGVEDDWHAERPTLTKTKGILGFPERILVLDRERVHKAYRDLLDPLEILE